MNNSAFIKVASAIPQVQVANCQFNAQRIEALIKQAAEKQVQIICFPELCITAYTCGDLFHQELLLDEAEKALLQLVRNTAHLSIVSIVGLPMRCNNTLYNIAVVFQKGEILGVVPKTNLCYEEQRYFSDFRHSWLRQTAEPSGEERNNLFTFGEIKFAVKIGDNQQDFSQETNIVFNLSATAELVGKNKKLKEYICQQSEKTAYIYVSAGFGESTTDLVFAGNAYIAENGEIIASSERFSFDEQLIIGKITPKSPKGDFAIVRQEKSPLGDLGVMHPFIPSNEEMDERCNEIFNIQVSGLATRIKHTGVKTVTIGISGGLDSTLALLVCVKTFDKLQIPRRQIIGVTMPGFGTTNQTYNNAIDLMQQLGISIREISIKEACMQHFKDIGHDENICNAVYENAQARERTQILMDIANQTDGLVVGTGDLSELALGWATYNGDHMSMYGVNAGVPKTLIRHLVRWAAGSENNDTQQTLLDIVETPVSPELLPTKDGAISQKTEDLVGPYELHDFFLYYTVRHGFRPAKIYSLATQAFENKYDCETIKKWLAVFFRRFFNQQFKRSCLPDGPKVGSVCLSPRGSWSMPSDASSEMWLKEIEDL